MDRETLEIEIAADGDVKVHVKGRKGARCMDIKNLMEELLGPAKSTSQTEEFYEEEAKVSVTQTTKTRSRK